MTDKDGRTIAEVQLFEPVEQGKTDGLQGNTVSTAN